MNLKDIDPYMAKEAIDRMTPEEKAFEAAEYEAWLKSLTNLPFLNTIDE